jgi:hypothetical protein
MNTECRGDESKKSAPGFQFILPVKLRTAVLMYHRIERRDNEEQGMKS